MKKIQDLITETKTAIEGAVFIGADTETLRSELAELEARLAEAQAAEDAAAQEAHEVEIERTEKQAAAAIEEAHDSVTAAAGADEVDGVVMPTPELSSDIAVAASRLVAVRHRLATEDQAYQVQVSKLAVIKSRLAEKNAARDEVLSRRLSGDERDGDAKTVNLLADDIESLTGLAAATEQAVNQLKPTEAARLVTVAASELDQAQRRAVLAVKQERLLVLEQAFVSEYKAMTELAASLGVNRFAAFKASNEHRIAVYGNI